MAYLTCKFNKVMDCLKFISWMYDEGEQSYLEHLRSSGEKKQVDVTYNEKDLIITITKGK